MKADRGKCKLRKHSLRPNHKKIQNIKKRGITYFEEAFRVLFYCKTGAPQEFLLKTCAQEVDKIKLFKLYKLCKTINHKKTRERYKHKNETLAGSG